MASRQGEGDCGRLLRDFVYAQQDSLVDADAAGFSALCGDCDGRHPGLCGFARTYAAAKRAEVAGDIDAMEDTLTSALDNPYLATAHGRWARATAHLTIRLAHAYRQDNDAGIPWARLALRDYREAGDPGGAARALTKIGIAHSNEQRPDTAMAYFNEALATANAGGAADAVLDTRATICVVLHVEGYSGALDTCHRVLAAAERVGNREYRRWALQAIAEQHQRHGRPDSAAVYLHAALPITRDGSARAEIFVALATGHLRAGHLDSAEVYLARLRAEPIYAHNERFPYHALVLEGELALANRAPARAVTLFDSAVVFRVGRLGAKPLHAREAYEGALRARSAAGQPSPAALTEAVLATQATAQFERRQAVGDSLRAVFADSMQRARIASLDATQRAQAEALSNRTAALAIGALAIIGLCAAVYATRRQRRRIARGKARVETLNRELNHRAHNQVNLAYQLIRDQQRGLRDTAAREALGRSERQLLALAAVNRRLARSGDDRLHADEVLTEVAEAARAAAPVPFALDLRLERASLPAEAVTKLALVLNELLANSVKYAFGGGVPIGADVEEEPPRVTVTLAREGGATVFAYADNGPGKDGVTRGTGAGSELIANFLDDLGARWHEPAGTGGYRLEARW